MAVGRPSALFALALLAAPILAAPLELKVVGDRVNLRSRPLAEAEVAGQVSAGETLLAPEGIPEGAEWVKVRPPPSTDLWIFSALVSDGVVTADDTYVRCGPGQHFRPVGKVPKGFRVEPRGAQAGDWLRIAPVPTAELYISSAYVLAVPPAPAELSNVSTAPAVEAVQPERSNGQTVKLSNAPTASAVEEVPAVATAGERESPKIPSSGFPAPSAQNEETPPVAEAVPTEPSNGSTAQRSNVATAAPAVEAPAEPEGPPMESAAPSVPPALAGLTLAPVPRQGETVRIRGRLERLSLARAPGFTRYQLTDKAGFSKSAAICRLIGLRGQWFELAGSEIDVEGRLWTLYGDPVPVLDATCVRRVASWEK